MCIIALIKEGWDMTDQQLENCYSHNTDGCGFSFVKEEKVVVRKMMSFKRFVKAFRKAQEQNTSTPFLVHFRDTSTGTTNRQNCHPFQINSEQSMAHNGTIYSVPTDPTGRKSDTAVFADVVLKTLPKKWDKNKTIVSLVTSFIGKNRAGSMNKVVMLNSDKSFTILNEKGGHWVEGVWYSNHDYNSESYWYTQIRYKSHYNKHNDTKVDYTSDTTTEYDSDADTQIPGGPQELIATYIRHGRNGAVQVNKYNNGMTIYIPWDVVKKCPKDPEDKAIDYKKDAVTTDCAMCNLSCFEEDLLPIEWDDEYYVCQNCYEELEGYRT